MSKQLQIRGGTTAQHSVFTGAVREITVDTDKDTLVVHDGVTVGGFPLAKESVTIALASDKEDKANKGVANGYASLDVNGKIPLTQISDSVLGQMEYMGIHNFSVDMPVATEKGQYWVASVAGNGYEVGDWAVWSGTAFDKVDNTDAVSSVAGRTGHVVLTKSDVGLSNVDNTSDANKPVSTATQTALNLKADTATTYNKTEVDTKISTVDAGAIAYSIALG